MLPKLYGSGDELCSEQSVTGDGLEGAHTIWVALQSPSALAVQLVEGAEAKAYYGLAINWGPLQALVERLLAKETLPGKEVIETLEAAGVVRFPDPYVEGFGWSQGGGLVYPGMPAEVCSPSPLLAVPTCAALLDVGYGAHCGKGATGDTT